MTQNKAKEMGFEEGSFCHDLHGHEKDILPNDAMKAVVALARAVRFLSESNSEKKNQYVNAAQAAFHWLLFKARPMGEYGLTKFQRGISEEIVIPKDEWQTRDLVNRCWASLAMAQIGFSEAMEQAFEFARKVMARQIPKEKAENGFYGHFYEFESTSHSELSWVHGIKWIEGGFEFGADIGAFYPNYLMPFVELLKLSPNHPDASLWEETLKSFAYNYLIPACKSNPFYIVPQGIYGEEGPLWFCGTFHGTNAVYGYTAALALELSQLFNEPVLKEIAYGNLQWIAGLNAGITKDNMKQGCVVFSMDIPEGIALPASMICHIGNRWAGTWFQTRGSICNGFSTGEQFKYDVEPKRKNDGPFSLTDEDWIPHAAGWLTGLSRL
jgi:hypothetical protein